MAHNGSPPTRGRLLVDVADIGIWGSGGNAAGLLRAVLASEAALGGGLGWALHVWWVAVVFVEAGPGGVVLGPALAAGAVALLTVAWLFMWLGRVSPRARAALCVVPLAACHALMLCLMRGGAFAPAAPLVLSAALLPVAYGVLTPWLAVVTGVGFRGTALLGRCARRAPPPTPHLRVTPEGSTVAVIHFVALVPLLPLMPLVTWVLVLLANGVLAAGARRGGHAGHPAAAPRVAPEGERDGGGGGAPGISWEWLLDCVNSGNAAMMVTDLGKVRAAPSRPTAAP